MPGTIQVSVLLGLIDVQTSSSSSSSSSSPSSSYTSIKVAMGKLQHLTSDSGDYIFPVTRLRENLIVTLLDVNGNELLHKEIETRMIIESGFLEEKFSFNGYGKIHLKMQFVLSEEDRNRIRSLRQSALRKKHDELMNGSVFTKSKSIASDLSSLSPMESRNTVVATVTSKTNLVLSQETEFKISTYREPVSSKLIMWKPEEVKEMAKKTKNQPSSSYDVSSSKNLSDVKKPENVLFLKQEDKYLILTKPENQPSSSHLIMSKHEVLNEIVEKTETQPSSSNVSSSKKILEAKKPEIASLSKQEDKGLSKPESNPKPKPMRRSMSETSLNNVRKMISTFEVKVTKDTKLQTPKIRAESCKDAEDNSKLENLEEKKINFEEKLVCVDNTERCKDLATFSSEEKTVFVEEKSLEQTSRISDSLSKQIEVSDDDKKQNKLVCLKDSHLENARGSRLWIFPDEAKDLSYETYFETRHSDLSEESLIQKTTEESTRENIDAGVQCRNIAKTNINNKWKNIERSKKQKLENSTDSDSSKEPFGQVMRAFIVVGFAGLVFLTRQ